MSDDLRPKPKQANVRPANHREEKHGAATDPESIRKFIQCSEQRRLEATRTRLKVRQ